MRITLISKTPLALQFTTTQQHRQIRTTTYTKTIPNASIGQCAITSVSFHTLHHIQSLHALLPAYLIALHHQLIQAS
jgi:hypothetical protein